MFLLHISTNGKHHEMNYLHFIRHAIRVIARKIYEILFDDFIYHEKSKQFEITIFSHSFNFDGFKVSSGCVPSIFFKKKS